MRASAFFSQLQQQIEDVKTEGLYKNERIIKSQQQAQIEVASGKVINFCANNYLGLANSPELIEAAQNGLNNHGFGVASVRFICGTQDIHKTLEQKISAFLETEDTILYSSCFDANTGLFETILGAEDAIISDSLNHASIIDGVRLCKAKRFRYANNDMADLEKQLIAADEAGAKTKLIATDGVFSMDGVICNLEAVCDLADKYDALVMVDDSHAVGFVGENGKGTPEYCNVLDRVDIITGTLGKALGGASGGYTSGKKEIVEWLRQRSRPYLFSNSLAPSIVTASIKVLEMLENGGELRAKLWSNAKYFREQMEAAGFTCAGKDHAIIPVMLGDAKVASLMADKLLAEGIYVTGFSFPVVPKGQARIRTQISAAHSIEQLDTAIDAFTRIGKEMGVI
ncbi:glycine C-acetyltransferase [Pseudoalteromonas sp. SR43-6]|jgi:glycine C-acetyltransferase|uniref:2-amino-3-ketobutyrate coenzyme A ligase n=2 Tax=Pseudoalteromonas TaxID=53246 RepID=F3BLG7_9GAMM|nr:MULTISPECIES: glycine C-acetyltransferase [Pseudoalteromonas]ATG76715.1 2-amino-3-ketobutyrate CoA ligase [Pseudoalteromonas sp. 1_2015MBL_MicDiv]EGI72543.1 2-amino-3-ketobutyrate coenzyme A ligase [Pseudoalteromonas distincta]KHM45650.1 2-amino-3-ketobutyrate CoA ligase [Pseudoalteromonas elyakovii]KID34363.1 2-amino-3-ketobutyrate CoA ligase [Pseudoalteromonas distincta]MBB1289375.1 glycine C-acetyltransferase [Pseudoalteromonas sp. SR41-5]|tara:strand:+ start:23446 stop:24639 length:1194 start_codon:yes stop_codon:yes gene_type:complete